MNNQNQQTILMPSLIFGMIGISFIVVFCLIHSYYPTIYQPRNLLKPSPPKLENMLSWISVVIFTKEKDLIERIGVDGLMFLRFFKMGAILFLVLSIPGMGMLAPMYYYSNIPTEAVDSIWEFEPILIKAVSIGNMPADALLIKIVIGFVWIFSFVVIGFLSTFYKDAITLKISNIEQTLRKNPKQIEFRTVMIHGIPPNLRSEAALSSYFDNLCIGDVETVVICRTWSRLQKAVSNRADCLDKLEEIAFKFKKNIIVLPPHHLFPRESLNPGRAAVAEYKHLFSGLPDRSRPKIRLGTLSSGPEVDAVDYYCDEFIKWDTMCNELRNNPEISASTGIAFVTFTTPVSAVFLIKKGLCFTSRIEH